MLSNPINLLNFHFISAIVTEFERVNSFFQATDADPEEMVQEHTLHHKSLQDRLFDRQGERLPIDKVDLGAKFTHELNSYASASSRESTGKVNEMRQ